MGILVASLNILGALCFFPLLLFASLELQAHLLTTGDTRTGVLAESFLFLFIPQISVSLGLLFNAIFSVWQAYRLRTISLKTYFTQSCSFAAITIWSVLLYFFFPTSL